MIKKFLPLCFLIFFGCATFNDLDISGKFDQVAKSYKSAIGWEEFEMAYGFMSKQNPKKKSVLPDKKFLKKIKITSYEVQNRKIYNDKLMVEQTVEIKYYNTDYLIEKLFVDNQIWIYESNSWRLSTGLPVFE
ncbi:MAG: hypothetical protein GY707_15745 [Desulfobacteraceae bacterium]|nr:hypothetical protein [Desulfobacteraceae bacterium]